MLTLVGSDTAKELIYSRFRIRDPEIGGYCHFPLSDMYDEVYFRQVTAEKRIRKYRKGVPYFEWDAGHRRNEALDCRVYVMAGLRILRQHRGLKLGKLPARKDKIPDREDEPVLENKRQVRSKKQNKASRWAGYEGKW